jgi:hypothetical protein
MSFGNRRVSHESAKLQIERSGSRVECDLALVSPCDCFDRWFVLAKGEATTLDSCFFGDRAWPVLLMPHDAAEFTVTSLDHCHYLRLSMSRWPIFTLCRWTPDISWIQFWQFPSSRFWRKFLSANTEGD